MTTSTFSADTWARIAPIRAAIDDLPFVRHLADGTLDRERFEYYLAQDALYLADYSRALAGIGAQALDPDEAVFWARSAVETIEVERQLHAAHVDDFAAATMSPTCTGYTSFLLARLTDGCYPVAAAAVLPCFWIYADVGNTLLARAGDLAGHPYGDWIATYADEAFAASVARAQQICDDQAARATPEIVERMHAAFATASRFEWLFWDAAWRRERWPV